MEEQQTPPEEQVSEQTNGQVEASAEGQNSGASLQERVRQLEQEVTNHRD